jgi:hypothetical protein
MNDMGLDTACPQPAGEPEAVPTGLEGDGNAVDLVTRLLRLWAPPLEQLYEFILVGRELLERLALDARYDPSNKPALLLSSITAINVWLGSNGERLVERLLLLLRLAHRWAPSARLLCAPMEPSVG